MEDGTSNGLGSAWQNTVDSSAAMLEALFFHDEFCDVTFRVGADGHIEDIRAHRVILASRSPVFATMFYGSLPENKAVVEITDTSPEVFKTMLRYLYIDKTSGITKENIVEMYSLAHKYAIEPLKSICADKTSDCATMENIGELLAMDAVLGGSCLDFIKARAWKLFQKEEYYKDLSQKHLIYIWQHDTGAEGPNKLPEMDICNGAVIWAKAECQRQEIPANDPRNQRQVLGPAFEFISFARMSMKDFYSIVNEGSLLTWQETARMTFYLINVENTTLPFSRPAVCVDYTSRTERIRRYDGSLVEVERSLLQDSIAGKRTCGCNCHASPKIMSSVQGFKCDCNCNTYPNRQCYQKVWQSMARARQRR